MKRMLFVLTAGMLLTVFSKCLLQAECTVVFSTISDTQLARTETCITRTIFPIDAFIKDLKNNNTMNAKLIQDWQVSIDTTQQWITSLEAIKAEIASKKAEGEPGTPVTEEPLNP